MQDLSPFLVEPGRPFRLADVDPRATLGLDKTEALRRLEENRRRAAELQERLYAEGRQSLLLILQAMDGGGKDSTLNAVLKGLDPQGCVVTSFKAPSRDELAHDFLWRVHHRAPANGFIGVFNRSHYEDVVIVKVHGWAAPELVEARYDHIVHFERLLHDHGTRVVKVFLHISKAYQLERLRRRLVHPDKWWKFDPADIQERAHWDEYMEAYETALRRTASPWAPWYVVPAEHKWLRSLLVSELLVQTLEAMDPRFPEPRFDPARYRPEDIN